jgi:hypothetical protein
VVETIKSLVTLAELAANASGVASAADEAELVQLPLCLVEPLGGSGALLGECLLAVGEEPCAATERGRVVALAGVEGEGLCGGAGERVGEPLDGAGGLDAVWGGVRVDVSSDGVEARLDAGAAESDVAPLPKSSLAFGEDEGVLDGESLRLVAGERVRMCNVSSVEVAGRERESAAVVELDDDRSLRAVDPGPCPALAVTGVARAVNAGA